VVLKNDCISLKKLCSRKMLGKVSQPKIFKRRLSVSDFREYF